MIASPCVRRCTLDETGQSCMGCLRTLDEIVDWSRLTDEHKLAVLERVAHRRTERAAGDRLATAAPLDAYRR